MNSNLLYIILVVILIINFVIFGMYNKLVKLQNRVKKESANIEIYLNKRFDLIPNLVEVVKGYSKHEGTTLENITALRSNYNNNTDLSMKQAEEMNSELNKFLAVVENYPDLKANTQYMSLQNELKQIEDQLGMARRRYNDVVTSYNTTIETVPSNIVASIFSFKKADLFEAEDSRKDNIKIEL